MTYTENLKSGLRRFVPTADSFNELFGSSEKTVSISTAKFDYSDIKGPAIATAGGLSIGTGLMELATGNVVTGLALIGLGAPAAVYAVFNDWVEYATLNLETEMSGQERA